MRFLGSQLPHRDVLSAVEDHKPRLLGISATTLSNLKAVDDMIEDTRHVFGQEVKVMVEGGAFRSRPGIWQDLRADGYGRNLREAVSVAAGLVQSN